MNLSKIKEKLPSRAGIMGINKRNMEYIYEYNPRSAFPNVDDKLRCKELLASANIPVPETLYVIDNHISLRTWPENVAGRDSFVIKPNRSYGGRGIVIIKCDGNEYFSSNSPIELLSITTHIQQILSGEFNMGLAEDKAYLEETVTNDGGIDGFLSDSASGIADIRIIFMKEHAIMAMLRIPTEESDGKANLHQGGLGIGIDMETGISIGGCHKNKPIDTHPETGRTLIGIEIPGFRKMIEYGKGISDLVGLGYIGIDFVVDRNKGIMVLEVNARPGLNIQIANMAGLCQRLDLW